MRATAETFKIYSLASCPNAAHEDWCGDVTTFKYSVQIYLLDWAQPGATLSETEQNKELFYLAQSFTTHDIMPVR